MRLEHVRSPALITVAIALIVENRAFSERFVEQLRCRNSRFFYLELQSRLLMSFRMDLSPKLQQQRRH